MADLAGSAFWRETVLHIVAAAAPRRIAAIGTESGGHTEALLEYCRASAAHLDLADIRADPVLAGLLARHAGMHDFYPFSALQAIPLLPGCDVAVIDTDANWYTIFHGLQLLFARAVEAGRAAPLVILHGAGWPHARRDSYRDPGMIPERHAYAQRGIVPGRIELDDAGVAGTRFNALREGGPLNGVLTALEDFVASWPAPVAMHVLPFMGGLAILVPRERADARVTVALETLLAAPSLLRLCTALDETRIGLAGELAARSLALARCADALGRARSVIARVSGEVGKDVLF